ncbi:type II secretion system F family protein [Rariglobus hedericola]|uniref:Type II secretion system F family protein n=1 Tax=Rariglobus hedericola TaxID=2597822 RepID=A0A556QJP6_9BACT|nr:type II secretion system F family protein [Rariglobus hedericola]TSJ76875.1 type II secretion system F family protein [Rariglobus hedericola]
MPSFTYTARNRSGQTVNDVLDAPTRKDAVRLLAARGLTPVQVSEASARPAPGKRKGKSSSGSLNSPTSVLASKTPAASSLTRRERLPFLESLVDLTTSGLSAGESVRMLSVRIKEPRLRVLCGLLWEQLSEGAQLSRAMGTLPAVFDSSTINLIQSGEATGNLNDVLIRLITHLQEQKELRRQILNALAYPAFMMVMAGGVIIFFMVFLLPRLQTLLKSLGGELPTSTRLLLGFSDFGLKYGIFVIAGLAFAAVAFWRWRHTEAGRLQTDAWTLKLPLIGPFSVSQTVLSFSQTLSVLLENGITTSEALRMTERQIGNRVHRAAFDAATDRVLEGEALSASLARTECFPDLVLDQLSVGENTGNLVPSLKKIATTYQKAISNQLNAFTKIIATVVLLGVFSFVGFIAFAIVSAVFQLSSSFKM